MQTQSCRSIHPRQRMLWCLAARAPRTGRAPRWQSGQKWHPPSAASFASPAPASCWRSMACASCRRGRGRRWRCMWRAPRPLPVRALTWLFRGAEPKERRVAGALTSLGPSYIKLGQFLATRADLIGPELAADLRHLQDKLPPFSMARGAPGRRGGARRPARGPLRRVRTAGGGGLHRPGAQGGRDRRRRAARGGGQDPAPRHRAPLPPRPRQLLSRRAPDRALPSAIAPAQAGGGGRHARALGRDRDGHAAGGRRHLRDGRQHRRRSGTARRRLPRARRRLAAHRAARADAGMDRRHPDLGSRRARRRRPRPEGAGPHRAALVPAARHARRLLPRRHAPGQPAGRQAGPHRRRRLRHHGSARPEGAPLPRRDPARPHHPRLPPHRRHPLRGGLRAAASLGRGVRAGDAGDRRADPRPHGRGDLDGGPARPAVRLHRGVRHGDAARAAAAAEDHGGGRGRGALARSRAQHVDRRRADRAGVDGRSTLALPGACARRARARRSSAG